MARSVAAVPVGWLTFIGAAVMTVAPPPLPGQTPRGVLPELRVDLVAGEAAALHVGAALGFPAGVYVRPVLAVAAGPARHDGATRSSVRVDALARFHLDPFKEQRTGWYAAAGLSALHDPWQDWRGLLTVAIGLELPSRAGGVWALEAGLGGGVRVGIALRQTRPGRR